MKLEPDPVIDLREFLPGFKGSEVPAFTPVTDETNRGMNRVLPVACETLENIFSIPFNATSEDKSKSRAP